MKLAEGQPRRLQGLERRRYMLLLDEGETSPRPLEGTDALLGAVAIAAAINEGEDRFLVSFTSLFIGMLAGTDPVGEWLRAQLGADQVGLEALLRRRELTIGSLEALFSQTATSDWLDRPLLRSVSARSALEQGARLARDTDAQLDTRHVMAAYISLPRYHDNDFRDLRIDRVAWAQLFGQAMARSYPAEARFWHSFRERVFPAASEHKAPAPPASNGASTPLASKGAPVQPENAGAAAPDAQLSLVSDRMERHVAAALRVADELAGIDPIDGLHVVLAVLELAPQSSSSAFLRLRELVPLASSRSPQHGSPTGELPAASRLTHALRARLASTQAPALAPSGASGRGHLWGRHLVTAALLTNEARLVRALEEVRCPLEELQEQWYLFVTTDSHLALPREAWNVLWQEAGVAPPGPRRAGYSTETDEGEDKLGIDVEARSFARLILDRNVKAPLSIGLLGDWGSGKSFFIEQLKKQIQTLKAQQLPEFFGNVIEIEFNAWHASDANLWASLVTYIFDEIWQNVSPAGKLTPEDAQKLLVEQLESARGAVHQAEGQVTLARSALESAEAELKRRREDLALTRYVKATAITELRELATAAGWHEELGTINEVEGAIESLAGSGQRVRFALAALAERPIRRIAVPTAGIAIATLVTCFFFGQSPDVRLSELGNWITATVGGIGALVAPITLVARKMNGFASTLESVRKGYDDALERTKKADPKEFARLTSSRRELGSAEASLLAAQSRLAELLNQQVMLDPRRRLGVFLEERVQSTQYRSQQGIISLVHKDFRELSTYMEQLRASAVAATDTTSQIKPFDRIVLYVDDLDRCRPDQVVHMLEAVNLLLALDLFVVVVAVDSRWLTRALEVHYKDLLGAVDGRENDGLRVSTPHGYLEKIFQITYALGPMDPKHFGGYVQSLANAEPPPRTGTNGAPDTLPKPEPGPRTIKPDSREATPAVAARRPGSLAPSTSPSHPPPVDALPPEPRPRLAAARPVRITKDEQDLVTKLVPLLPTPRIAKRLINVYRLIKASKSTEALQAFEQNRAGSCLFMLAVLFGRPTIGSELLRALHERAAPFDDEHRTLLDAVKIRCNSIPSAAPASPTPEADEQWLALQRTLIPLELPLTVGDCAREPMEIARYSLVSGHDWHTWARSAAG